MSDNMKDYRFDLPKNQKSIIKVIGVGGGGSNAVNHMYGLGIKDVEFVVVNTDAQALKSSPVPLRLQLGANLTEGLGAGANPEQGRRAALETEDEIRAPCQQHQNAIYHSRYGWRYRYRCCTDSCQNRERIGYPNRRYSHGPLYV